MILDFDDQDDRHLRAEIHGEVEKKAPGHLDGSRKKMGKNTGLSVMNDNSLDHSITKLDSMSSMSSSPIRTRLSVFRSGVFSPKLL